MIRPIEPDEPVMVNGVPVTGRMLAEARQELSHRGVHNPRWAELTRDDQDRAALSAAGWLRALSELLEGATGPEHVTPPPGLPWPSTEPSRGPSRVAYRMVGPPPAAEPPTVDLDSTRGCPKDAQCAGCAATVDLVVELATTPVGIYCLTLCSTCVDRGQIPRPAGWRDAFDRVARHCQHLGIDLDQMGAAIERENTKTGEF